MTLTLRFIVSFLLASSSAAPALAGCPFQGAHSDVEGDATGHGHPCPASRNLRRGSSRRLSSLANDPTTKERLSNIIHARRAAASSASANASTRTRSLQEGCVTLAVYQDLQDDVAAMANAITNIRDRGHFIGGIVRLAAHDFMDFDGTAPADQQLGPDGCIDFTHPANAGLDSIWCDDQAACPLQALHDTGYPFMSRADFWIAAANAVIRETSIGNALVLPFRWGRSDRDPNQGECSASSSRLPAEGGCSDVEAVFLTRMGLTWRDAVALLGAHTLGRGHAAFSGHDGAWVDTDEEAVVFDKRFYEEVMRRSWFPRTATNPAGEEIQNWTWGGNRADPVMMLNTDICLKFDIPEGTSPVCCTDTGGNCRGNFDNTQCPSADQVRPEAVLAFDEFIGGANLNNNNNDPFYGAFVTAWEAATENGHTGLSALAASCEVVGPTAEPTGSPSTSPSISVSPTDDLSASPTATPTTATPTTAAPTSTPTTSQAPTNSNDPFSCEDAPPQSFTDSNGNARDCNWVVSGDRCKGFGHLCPLSCDACLCRGGGMVCASDMECCSLECKSDATCKTPKWAKCDKK